MIISSFIETESRRKRKEYSRVDGFRRFVLEPQDKSDLVPVDGRRDVAGKIHRRALDRRNCARWYCKRDGRGFFHFRWELWERPRVGDVPSSAPDLSASFLAHGRRHVARIGQKSFAFRDMFRSLSGRNFSSHSNFLPFSWRCQKCEIEKHGNRPSLPRRSFPAMCTTSVLHRTRARIQRNRGDPSN